jgi:hypothetical protein
VRHGLVEVGFKVRSGSETEGAEEPHAVVKRFDPFKVLLLFTRILTFQPTTFFGRNETNATEKN